MIFIFSSITKTEYNNCFIIYSVFFLNPSTNNHLSQKKLVLKKGSDIQKRFKVSQYRMKTVAKLFYMPKFRMTVKNVWLVRKNIQKTAVCSYFSWGFFRVCKAASCYKLTTYRWLNLQITCSVNCWVCNNKM